MSSFENTGSKIGSWGLYSFVMLPRDCVCMCVCVCEIVSNRHSGFFPFFQTCLYLKKENKNFLLECS